MTDFLTELRDELLDGLERYEQAPRWRRFFGSRGRRSFGPAARRLAAAAVAAAVAVAVIVQLADRSPEIEQGTTPEVSHLEGFQATGAAVADGSLWVTRGVAPSLLRIDLQTGKVRASIDVQGASAVIAGAGAVWVHDWEHGRLIKVDPRTNRVVKIRAIGSDNSDIAFAGGAVWAIDKRGLVLRLDPDTLAETKRVSLGADAPPPAGSPHGLPDNMLVPAGNVLWVVVGNGRITEIDARTGRILGRARGPQLQIAVARRAAADESGLWISSPYRRQVLHIDARTRRLTRFPVHGDPEPVATVDGRVWVGTLHDTGAVTRVTVLNTDGRILGTIPVPHPAVNFAPSPGGGAWVTFGEDGSTVFSPAAVRISGP